MRSWCFPRFESLLIVKSCWLEKFGAVPANWPMSIACVVPLTVTLVVPVFVVAAGNCFRTTSTAESGFNASS